MPNGNWLPWKLPGMESTARSASSGAGTGSTWCRSSHSVRDSQSHLHDERGRSQNMILRKGIKNARLIPQRRSRPETALPDSAQSRQEVAYHPALAAGSKSLCDPLGRSLPGARKAMTTRESRLRNLVDTTPRARPTTTSAGVPIFKTPSTGCAT